MRCVGGRWTAADDAGLAAVLAEDREPKRWRRKPGLIEVRRRQGDVELRVCWCQGAEYASRVALAGRKLRPDWVYDLAIGGTVVATFGPGQAEAKSA